MLPFMLQTPASAGGDTSVRLDGRTLSVFFIGTDPVSVPHYDCVADETADAVTLTVHEPPTPPTGRYRRSIGSFRRTTTTLAAPLAGRPLRSGTGQLVALADGAALLGLPAPWRSTYEEWSLGAWRTTYSRPDGPDLWLSQRAEDTVRPDVRAHEGRLCAFEGEPDHHTLSWTVAGTGVTLQVQTLGPDGPDVLVEAARAVS